MHWIQLLFETGKNRAAELENELTALGAMAVTLSDAEDQPLFEPDPGDTPLWDAVRVMGLFDAATETDQLIQTLTARLAGALPPHKIEILEDKDWVKAWMDQFQPIQFSDRLWICPTWLEPPDPSAANIMLDPGMAFGTGTHATTALCLEWLANVEVDGKTLVDYGCGSGILGIGALLLGCGKVRAVDIDPQALQATANNVQQNNISPQWIEISLPQNLTADPADIVVANILAGPLTGLAPVLTGLVKPGGKIALSGILTSQTEQITAVYQKEFDFDTLIEKDGWVLLSATKMD